MKSHKIKKLHVGCGKYNLPDWINGDIDTRADVYLGATKRLPFKNNEIDFIFCEHFIEHLSRKEAEFFLKECFRVLEKNRVMRVSTPDLELLVKTYLDENPFVRVSQVIERHKTMNIVKARNEKNITKCEWLNDKMRAWEHKFIYDFETLTKILKECGFSRIKKCKFGESEHKELRNLEKHADVKWMKTAEPLILEAEK